MPLLIALALLIVPTLALAQARTAFKLAVFGDTQRQFSISNDLPPEISSVQRLGDETLSVANTITWGPNAIITVGDLIAEGSASAANTDLCSAEEWNRWRNVFLGPRSTLTNGSACAGACACSQSGILTFDFQDNTSLNDGTVGFLSVARTVPLITTAGNHDDVTKTILTPTRSTSFEEEAGPVMHGRYYSRFYMGSFRNDNGAASMAFLIPLGGRPTLVLSIACGPGTGTIAWAVRMLKARRHLPAIITTHIALNDDADNLDLTVDNDAALGDGTANCNSANVVAGNLQTNILDVTTNVRMTFHGHAFVIGTKGHTGSTGISTALGGASVLRELVNWQGWDPSSDGSGCYQRLAWTANTVTTTTYGHATRGTDCSTPVAAQEFDASRDDAPIPLPFDPAPCNGLMVDRVDRVERARGCG